MDDQMFSQNAFERLMASSSSKGEDTTAAPKSQGPRKRAPLTPVSQSRLNFTTTPTPPQTVPQAAPQSPRESSPSPRSPTPASINVGGSSKLEWFGPLATEPHLESVRRNLFGKIAETEDLGGGCTGVLGFREDTRPTPDRAELAILRSVRPDAPARYSPYVLAMARDMVLLPQGPPPRYPPELRQVKAKRRKTDSNDKDATWVASHLCHNRRCINTEHMTWEPSWFNRLRDNCPGGELCRHRPKPCLNPHRQETEAVLDWTEYM